MNPEDVDAFLSALLNEPSLPALAGHQLAEALEESLQSCVAARQALSHQLASIHT